MHNEAGSRRKRRRRKDNTSSFFSLKKNKKKKREQKKRYIYNKDKRQKNKTKKMNGRTIKDQIMKLFVWILYSIQQAFINPMREANEASKKHIIDDINASKVNTNNSKKKKEKICLVMAHPDDEAMFFTPILQSLIWDHHARFDVSILCFTTGNYDGLGKIRKEELRASCKTLGIGTNMTIIRSPTVPTTWRDVTLHRIILIEDERMFPDHPTKKWSTHWGGQFIHQLQQKAKYDAFITFDKSGVSSHVNHQSVHEIIKTAQVEYQNIAKIPCYQLKTLPMWTKYLSLWSTSLSMCLTSLFSRPSHHDDSTLVFYGTNFKQTYKTLAQHSSQFVWYRQLSIFFSQYSFVNYMISRSP